MSYPKGFMLITITISLIILCIIDLNNYSKSNRICHKKNNQQHLLNVNNIDLIGLQKTFNKTRIVYLENIFNNELKPPYTTDLLILAAKLMGMRLLKVYRPSCRISAKTLPSLALSNIQSSNKQSESEHQLRIDLIVDSRAGKITYMPANENRIITVRCDEYAKRYTENLLLIVERDCE